MPGKTSPQAGSATGACFKRLSGQLRVRFFDGSCAVKNGKGSSAVKTH